MLSEGFLLVEDPYFAFVGIAWFGAFVDGVPFKL